MIRRHPPRHRGQHQDFHFFAGAPAEPLPAAFEGQPISETPSSTSAPVPAPSSAIEQAIEFLAKVEDPSKLIGSPRPPFMQEIEAIAASRPKPAVRRATTPKSLRSRKRKHAAEPGAAASAPGATHHERHCHICSHPDRADIEADFIEWALPDTIAREYNISRASIYRHARAAGLFACRRRNLSFALSRVIECVDSVQPTADSIVRAIHGLARINDNGEWVEPPAHVIVSSGGVRREAPAPPARRPIAISLDSPALANVIDVPTEALPSAVSTSRGGTPLPGAPTAPLRCGVLPETADE